MDFDAVMQQLKINHARRQKAVSVLCFLSLVVALLVFWQLRIIGITMTDEACCGMIEHTHDESCEESRILICGLGENSLSYICGYEDGEEILAHTHGENCYDENEALICEIPETEIHHHGEECIETPAHAHSDECYKNIYTCESEEHIHTLYCYTDSSADVESATDWNATLPRLFNDYAADLVNVASSQLGYRESTRNVLFDTDANGITTKRGYTRYGAWYGGSQQFTHIDNWSAMFVSFCLHNAAIPEEFAPQNHGCNTMMQEWQTIGSFADVEAYSPIFGDLVFLSKDTDGFADGIGIISSVNEDGFTTIEGNSNECVEENFYAFSDISILGYGILQRPKDGGQIKEQDGISSPVDEDTPKNTDEPSSFSEFTSAASWIEERTLHGKSVMIGRSVVPSSELDMFIRDINGDGQAITGSGTVRNPVTGHYDTSLRIEFSMQKSVAVASLSQATGSFRYDLPGEIIISEQLLNNSPYPAYKVGDSSVHAFDYWFKVNPEKAEGQAGHYYIEIKYDVDYLTGANADVQISNYIDFSCSIFGDDNSSADGIQVTFGGDFNLDIPPNQINEHYDVAADKSGAYISTDGDKLRYTVTISSGEGTPGPIEISDQVFYTESGGNSSIGSPALVSVTKHPSGINVTTGFTFTPRTGDPTAFDMTLPQLGAGESYRVTYEYCIIDLPEGAEFTAGNEISAATESNIKSYHDTAAYVIRRSSQPKVAKSGALLSTGDIKWEIVVNPGRGDIVGKILTDPMFVQLTPGDILVQNSNNRWNPTAASTNEYTIQYDPVTGKVTGIQFNAVSGSATNTNCYTISYTTATDVSFGETDTITNTATFDGETGSSTVGVPGGSVSKVVGEHTSPNGSNPGTITWNVVVNIPSGGIAAGTEFEDIFGVSGSTDSDDHYMTAQQYTALEAALQNEDWWDSITCLAYTTDGVNFGTGPPASTDRILGYRFEVNSDPAGSALAGQALTWTYTTTASMESSGSAVTYPEYDPTIPYTGGAQVHYQGFVYQAKWYTKGTTPSADPYGPWLNLGPAGGAADYRSFTNTLNVGEKEIMVKKSFSTQVRKYNVIMGESSSFTLNEADGSFHFNETSTDTTFRWAVEVDATAEETYRVIDTLPKEVKLSELYVGEANQYNLTLWGSKIENFSSDGTTFTATPTGYHVSGSYNANGSNVIDLEITPAASGKFRVLYVCELDDAYLPEAGERVTYLLGNSVAVEVDNEIIGEAENTITVTAEERKSVTDKSGALNYKKKPDGTWMLDNSGNMIWDNTITYTVDINPRAENLLVNPTLDPNDTLHLKDMLSYTYRDSVGTGEATLGLSSISLVDADTNETIEVEWTVRTVVVGNEKTSIIEGDVPDGRHLVLTYTYSVWSTMQDGIKLHNEVTLDGESFQHSEYEEEHGREEFETHAASDYMEYRLIKVDKESRRPLAGALFEVYKWALDPAGNTYTWIPLGKTYISDADGVIKISPSDKAPDGIAALYSNNTAYCVMETVPPNGYVLDEENRPTYCFWISENNAQAPTNAPIGFTDQAVDLANSSGQEYVENERDANQNYLLPETGSTDTRLYVLGGFFLMVFSMVFGYRQRHKRERRLP